MCGGTAHLHLHCSGDIGLSPRVRGNHRQHHYNMDQTRSIPACAGEPGRGQQDARGDRVYPRVCGGTAKAGAIHQRDWGLSPRVRGNPAPRTGLDGTRRSIPACAGEPKRGGSRIRSGRVYPRVCGGTIHLTVRAVVGGGLSPRVRGNLGSLPKRLKDIGSIPACAGEPAGGADHGQGQKVYPRVCGGTTSESTTQLRQLGLSPRVRGNPYRLHSSGQTTWSIPACAGEPRYAMTGIAMTKVYPRVCGGTLFQFLKTLV